MPNLCTQPFSSGSSLQELPELTEKVFFAFHFKINKLIYLNPAFEKLWGITREVVGSDLSVLISTVHADDRKYVEEAVTTIQKERQTHNLEFRIVLPDNNCKWVRVDVYLSKKSNDEIITGMATDITADKSYGDVLHKFNDRKNSILQILAHDLLGPLGNIQILTDILFEHDKLKDDDSVLKMLTVINNSSKRGVTMIRDLIDDEFLKTSQSALVKQRVDIIEKIGTLVDQYKQSPRSLPQRFIFSAPLSSLFVNIDESKFTQAVNNLLSNALKFTGDDGRIEVSITESVNKRVLIKIQDNGIGIPADLQPFIFDKFTRARRMGVHGEPTTGLGMSIIKTIVEWHSGRIWFDSEEGKGTTFYIEIPKDN